MDLQAIAASHNDFAAALAEGRPQMQGSGPAFTHGGGPHAPRDKAPPARVICRIRSRQPKRPPRMEPSSKS